MRWARTVRGRTTILASLLVAVTLAVASALLVLTLQRSLTEIRDQVSRDLAGRLADDVTAGTLHSPIAAGEDAMAQVVGPGGEVLAASESLGAIGPVTDATVPEGGFRLLVLEGVPDDADTETYRVWATTASSPDGPVRIFVGGSPERVSEAVRALRAGLTIGVPAVVVALAGAVSFLVGRALGPVERIRADVAEITAGRLGRRVPEPATGDEIERLAHTMNAMLQRLDDADRRNREFVGDASHELLSPLASVRTQLEVAAATPDTTDWSELVHDLTGAAADMEALVQDLLFLAREDAGAGRTPAELVDLDDLVLEAARRLQLGPGITLDTAGVSAAPVRGVPGDLTRLVRNLLENAADHARSTITVGLELTCGRAVLTVTDDGAGVPTELREQIFERFVRSDSARERRAGAGTGLGLSIARAIAVRHGGRVALDDVPTGTRLRVDLPAA